MVAKFNLTAGKRFDNYLEKCVSLTIPFNFHGFILFQCIRATNTIYLNNFYSWLIKNWK